MAGLLTGDYSQHGMSESGPYSFSQDKPEEGGRWYLSRKEIEENSPSRRDGIDLKKEAYLRKSYCTFLQDLGMRLKVPQVTIATAIIFCHRFFLRQSHAKNDRRTIATVCMFLAGKVEETPRPLKDVILVSYEIIHKKDPTAVQRIKQKEVYEQQKELILIGERVVLATLGFDFNVNHPYKPLVEAIKKFKVAQNALAQVAWNFVNDGLRTSLCLQFKPHHIAAGAIFLAAKFLKVKLPSDGEKVWWQEFDVTPRQLEEVSNQMLELYEQNRVLPSQGSEVEGGVSGGAGPRASAKTPANEESVLVNGYAQGAITMKPGVSMSSSNLADNQSGPQRSTQNQSNDNGGKEARSSISDHMGNSEVGHPEQEPIAYKENMGETSNRSGFGSEQILEEDQERNNNWRSESMDEGRSGSSTGVRNLGYREGPLGQSPQDGIKKIDKDKVKAALEKRKKSLGEVTRKKDLIDDEDLIERVLEDDVELAAVEDDKIKRERKHIWSSSKFSDRSEPDNFNNGKVKGDDIEDGNYAEAEGHSQQGSDVENVEEGELSLFDDDANQGFPSPKLSNNRKRKAVSPDKLQLEGKQRLDYVPGYPRHNHHHDILEDGNRMGPRGYGEKDHKRHLKENRV